MMIRFRSIAALCIVTLLLVGSGCQNGGSGSTELSVEDFRYVQLPSGERQVIGTVHNPTEKRIATAQVQVSLFNKDNERIDQMQITVEDIPASGSQKFKETVNAPGAVQGARVRSIIVM